MSWVAWDKMTIPKNSGGLGFRDIEEYNDALLAKLSWRVLTHTDILLSRVLLGKYCHKESFLLCSPPTNASHGWRGIIEGRKVLTKGLGWLIGDGDSVRVWDDPWLSTSEPLTPIGPRPLHLANLKVSDLIHRDSNTWNWDRIRRFIPMYEPQIRLLQLSGVKHKDNLAWLFNKNGKYTTRSGYGSKAREAATPAHREFNWQKNVWRLKTQPKIKTFLWKAPVRALPTGEQLIRRGIGNTPSCHRCGELESVEHILLSCAKAREVWAMVPIPQPRWDQILTTLDFLEKTSKTPVLPPIGITTASLQSWVCWNLWIDRNSSIFENKTYPASDIVMKAIREAKAWELAQESLPQVRRTSGRVQSEPLLVSGVRMCTDASWQRDAEVCGLGWWYEDPLDGRREEFSLPVANVSSALAAETLAIIMALRKTRERGIDSLNVCSDSQVLINLLNSKESHTELYNLLFEIRYLATQFRWLKFSFVPREANMLADSLAKRAFDTLVLSTVST